MNEIGLNCEVKTYVFDDAALYRELQDKVKEYAGYASIGDKRSEEYKAAGRAFLEAITIVADFLKEHQKG